MSSTDSNQASATFPTTACYNCRQRRRRCDKSQPSCHRCSRDGEECLGYGRVLRWVDFPTAAAGKKRRSSSKSPEHGSPSATARETTGVVSTAALIRPALVDPLLNDLSDKSRLYIKHYTGVVCSDLVSLDQIDHNPFRKVVLLVDKHDYLRAIVVATAAMHKAVQHRHQGISSPSALVDALSSKAKAISLLRAALQQGPVVNKEVLLAAVVFFINLDLIDSGKGTWQSHMQAASTLISSLQTTQQDLDYALASMANAVAADCLTYHILGSTISAYGPDSAGFAKFGEKHDVISILSRHEAHSYQCCPPFILRTIMSASRLFDLEPSARDEHSRYQVARSLLRQARDYDVEEWVYGIRGLAPTDDLPRRVHVASAHRAACCLYIVLAVSKNDEGLPDEPNTRPDDFVDEIYECLKLMPPNHPLLKGLIWPTFMAGAQTDDTWRRGWFMDWLCSLLACKETVCPWGYVKTAIDMLQEIWDRREGVPRGERSVNWLQELKGVREGYLIV
ncbi:Fungal specific transcription factor domain containing protein [Naviculisporaceae sp. PSN 640]